MTLLGKRLSMRVGEDSAPHYLRRLLFESAVFERAHEILGPPTAFSPDTLADCQWPTQRLADSVCLKASDRASKGEYDDLSGPAIEGFLEEALTSEWEVERRLVEDERESIEAALIDLIDNHGCSVVVTTGGTGPSQRDVTPEATENVCEKVLPGFGEQMRAVSMRHVPTAMLSRQMAGIEGPR
ncbi:MAG: hypothetical protein Ct9H90mP24_7130 [Methanobacteriota archaeon]|nr:MAG: hypothetical protein Ct9H90mP24_7130 [Euryarchaeota archaeon]